MKRRRGRPEVPRSMNFQKEKAPCPTWSVFLETSENCGHKVEGIIRDEPGGGWRRREGIRRTQERDQSPDSGGDGDGRWISKFRMIGVSPRRCPGTWKALRVFHRWPGKQPPGAPDWETA